MYRYGYGDMMLGGSLWHLVVGMLIVIDLALLGVWLWKQINKN